MKDFHRLPSILHCSRYKYLNDFYIATSTLHFIVVVVVVLVSGIQLACVVIGNYSIRIDSSNATNNDEKHQFNLLKIFYKVNSMLSLLSKKWAHTHHVEGRRVHFNNWAKHTLAAAAAAPTVVVTIKYLVCFKVCINPMFYSRFAIKSNRRKKT